MITKRVHHKQDVYKAEQNHAETVSPRAILQRYLGGDRSILEQKREAQFYDTTREPTRADMLNQISQARTVYENLPDRIKARFGGSFQQMVQFLNNPANREEARRIGLLKPVKPPIEPTITEKTLAEIRDRLPEKVEK